MQLVFRALLALEFAFCPLLQFSTASPAILSAPAAPVPAPTGQPEEEKSQETKSEAALSALARASRRATGSVENRCPITPSRIANSRSGALPRAAAADPYRNGLGCPFRC